MSLKIETKKSIETLVRIFKAIRRHMPETLSLHKQNREKSQILLCKLLRKSTLSSIYRREALK
jgi:hypothetical protein